MKVSLNWLKKYINLGELTPEEISDTLTDLGLEVETVETVEPLQGDVVAGEVLSAEQHPDADKLRVCQVRTADGEDPLTIVCGAPNARAGIKVAVAKIGSVLPGDFKIKKGKIRGQVSEGMLCSGAELEVSADSDGIIELAADTPLGTSISALYGLSDTVFEIGLTPNRADCLGYIGVARDLAAKLDIALNVPAVPGNFGTNQISTESTVNVAIDDGEDSARFCALYIEGVSVVDSPAWLQQQLQNSGVRPLNLIVDVGNYVMLEQSQPIHTYDKNGVSGQYLAVRRAKDGETLTTLDDVERKLSPNDLVIADREKAIGLAGVMGGASSQITENTKDVIIEVAHFEPRKIRHTAKNHALHSDASHRFERGVDIANIDTVAKRYGQLLYQVTEELIAAGADLPLPKIASDVVDHYFKPAPKAKIAVRLSKARKVLGQPLLRLDQCVGFLQKLGFEYIDKTDDRVLVEVPSFRHDIEREIDLIEEIGRVKGYDSIPATLPVMEILPGRESPHVGFLQEAGKAMAMIGFNEAILFPFIGESDLETFRISSSNPFYDALPLRNPLTEDAGLMTTLAVINLAKAAARNLSHGVAGVKLFEIGRTFFKQSVTEKLQGDAAHYLQHMWTNGFHLPEAVKAEPRTLERTVLSAIMAQPQQGRHWRGPEQPWDFFSGKERLERWLSHFGIRNAEYHLLADHPLKEVMTWLHPKRSAVVTLRDTLIGSVGELHPETALALGWELGKAPIVFGVDLENVHAGIAAELGQDKTYESYVTKYPSAHRDLALVVDRSMPYQQITDAITGFKRRKNLSHWQLFDVYQGEHMAADKKSVGIECMFSSTKKTLADKEVDKEVTALIDWLKTAVGAELR